MEDITVNEIGYDKDTTKDHNDNDTSPGELWLQLCLIVNLLQIRAWCRLLLRLKFVIILTIPKAPKNDEATTVAATISSLPAKSAKLITIMVDI